VRVSAETAAGPGKGAGWGAAGNANTPFAAALLLPAALLEGTLFSAAVAAFVASSPAPPLFC